MSVSQSYIHRPIAIGRGALVVSGESRLKTSRFGNTPSDDSRYFLHVVYTENRDKTGRDGQFSRGSGGGEGGIGHVLRDS